MGHPLIVNTTDSQFEEDVLQAEGLVLVDFWAPWCGPCKMIAPILDEIAGEYEGKVKIVKLNVDDNQEITVKYGIRGIPALFLFRNGQAIAQKKGALPKSQLTAFLDSNI